MKLNVGDVVVIKTPELSLRVKVEDASKGDVIMAKVQSLSAGSKPPYLYEAGKIYEFNRKNVMA